MKSKVSLFARDEQGEFSIKGLAITIGAIVVIGAIVTWLSEGQLAEWIEQVWLAIWDWMQGLFGM